MADTHFRFVERHLKAHEEQAENWKADHEKAMACLEFEEYLDSAISLFQHITRVDEGWHNHVFTYPDRYDPKRDEAILGLYRRWLKLAEGDWETVARLEKEYGTVRGADEFRRCYRAAQGVLTPDDAFFTGEGLVKLRDEAVDAHRRGEAAEMRETGD